MTIMNSGYGSIPVLTQQESNLIVVKNHETILMYIGT